MEDRARAHQKPYVSKNCSHLVPYVSDDVRKISMAAAMAAAAMVATAMPLLACPTHTRYMHDGVRERLDAARV